MAVSFPAVRGIAVLAVLGVMTAGGKPAAAETLSDMLNQRIVEAQRAEAERLFEVALNSYAQALQISTDTPQARRLVLKKRATLYEQIGMLEKAEADLTAALSTEPFDPKAYADRGYFYLRHGRHKEALDDFIAGSRADPKNAMFLYGAARVLVAAQDDTNAVKFYTEAAQIAPGDAKIYLGRAEALLRLQRFPDAVTDYDRAFEAGLTDREQRYFSYVGRGYASMMMADFGSAVRSFDRALDISSDASNVLLMRAYAYERQGARDLALRDYQRAAAGMPDLAEARNGVARLRSQLVGTVTAGNITTATAARKAASKTAGRASATVKR
ncbi:MAG TPA: tetratricopeptide repeat protein [Xanthobacteraceae bacterium]|nr:tetratricopeptide repeat protein [Xanthobacteraceae bacterium]